MLASKSIVRLSPVNITGIVRRASRTATPFRFSKPACGRKRCTFHTVSQSGPGFEGAKTTQRRATDMFAELLKAPDQKLKAEELADELNEEFFLIASTYLQMARKEKNKDVSEQLERTLKIAMDAKNSVLRGEIRLLNSLLQATNQTVRKAMFAKEGQYLVTDKEYFFTLVKRMQDDVRRRKGSEAQNKELLEKLVAIEEEATKEKLNWLQ